MDNSVEKTISTVWNKSKWLVKGLIIGVLALLMMIPMMIVKDLVIEREKRQREATLEIRSKWAGMQNIIGPVIGIPYEVRTTDTNGKVTTEINTAYFLPDNLDIKATVNPKEKHRGIFKVMLYDADVNISGSFGELPLGKLNLTPEQMRWKDAFVTMNIADNRGLNDELALRWNDSTVIFSPQRESGHEGLRALLAADSKEDFTSIKFNTRINLNGSGQLFFTPIGKSTSVQLKSSWADPSFSGSVLPQSTEISDSGFQATWKNMSHTRKFPQQWIGDSYLLDHAVLGTDMGDELLPKGSEVAYSNAPSSIVRVGSAAFGVDLFIPVNGYQKILRTIKYALLCIVLTFAAFFLIETANKKSAHPFQYGLIGLALILFYTLLLSISEYTGFNVAYGIASFATIGLIAWFVRGILDSGRATTILSVVLILVYSFIFSLLQLQDYSLLLGSIGLFLTLGVLMYFSKKLQW